MKKIAAALTLFTRLPLWKWMKIPAEAYSPSVVYWPFTGWFTAGLATAVFRGLSYLIPIIPAIIIALMVQVMFTGALHEDGLADFCDGFGGGRDKESILRIMKDSHIGTYGVIGLIFYFLLVVTLLCSLPTQIIPWAILASDTFSKLCASQIINTLPYARKEGSKNKIEYQKMSAGEFTFNLITGALPLIPLLHLWPEASLSLAFPILTAVCLILYMKHKIGGYTGDCCGATALICKVMMIVGIVLSLNL